MHTISTPRHPICIHLNKTGCDLSIYYIIHLCHSPLLPPATALSRPAILFLKLLSYTILMSHILDTLVEAVHLVQFVFVGCRFHPAGVGGHLPYYMHPSWYSTETRISIKIQYLYIYTSYLMLLHCCLHESIIQFPLCDIDTVSYVVNAENIPVSQGYYWH